MGDFLVITFPSTNHALKAERTLMKKGFEVKAVPVPRNISSDCGIALKIKETDRQDIELFFEAEGLQKHGIYDL